MKTIWFLLIIVTCISVTKAQTIEKFSIDSGGEFIVTENMQVLYTIGEVNIQEINSGGIRVSGGFINSFVEGTLNVAPHHNDEGLIVFPNPATDILNIRSTFEITAVELVDHLGKSVITSYINNYQLDVSRLSKGIYFLKITKGNMQIVKKIVIY